MEVCSYEDAKPTGAAHERRRVLPPACGNGARNAKGSLSRLQPDSADETGFMQHAPVIEKPSIKLAHAYVFARTTATTLESIVSAASHARKPTGYVVLVAKLRGITCKSSVNHFTVWQHP